MGVVLALAGLGALAPVGWAVQACPNEGVRARQLHASSLPDCRAYVQVTPVDKGNVNALGFPGSVTASPDGDRVRYYSITAFEGTASPETSVSFYVSSRVGCVGVVLCDGSEEYGGKKGAGEWATLGVLPFNTTAAVAYGFSEDLSQTLVSTDGSGVEEPAGYYLLETSSGIYRLLLATPEGQEIWPAGFSADGRQLIFESGQHLAPGEREGALNTYEFDSEKPVGEQISLIGVVPPAGEPSCGPSGPACETSPVGSVAGAGAGDHIGSESAEPTYTQSAISADGSVVVFTAASGVYEGKDGHDGLLYARVGGEETLAVSAGVAHFLAATPDGRYIFYTEAGQLFRYDLQSKGREEITTAAGAGVLGTLGVSEEGTSVFFAAAGVLAHNTRIIRVSASATLTEGSNVLSDLAVVDSGSFLTAGQEITGEGIPAHTTITEVSASSLKISNPAEKSGGGVALSALAHEAASAAGPNLYEYNQSSKEPLTFIAGLSGEPEEKGDVGDWRDYLLRSGGLFTQRSSRLTPDGQTLLFSSRGALTGYDSNGYQEFFRYRAPAHEDEAPSLICVSCGPPASQANQNSFLTGNGEDFNPTSEAALTRNLSENGQRVFFQTGNRLLPEASGLTGVYEWEADGEGSCHTETQNGGCLSLISAGANGEEYFADASANGNDVFFFTHEPLAETDTDTNIDVYDACTDCGNEPESENTSNLVCRSGETCHPPTPPETPTTPPSATLNGTGNLPSPPPATPPPPPKKPSNAQLLAKALKACRTKHNKHKRTTCETQAHKHYPTKTKKTTNTTHHTH